MRPVVLPTLDDVLRALPALPSPALAQVGTECLRILAERHPSGEEAAVEAAARELAASLRDVAEWLGQSDAELLAWARDTVTGRRPQERRRRPGAKGNAKRSD